MRIPFSAAVARRTKEHPVTALLPDIEHAAQRGVDLPTCVPSRSRHYAQGGEHSVSPKLSFFISYAHADRSLAVAIADELERAGMRVWVDEGELRAGDSIVERIADAVDQVDFVVALVTRRAVASNWCKKELALAIQGGLREGSVRLLPLRVDDVEMPPSLRDLFHLHVDSRNPMPVVRKLVADAWSHFREQQLDSCFLGRVVSVLQPTTTLSAERQQALKLALRSNDDDYNSAARAEKLLAKDLSVPAAEILYEDALDDALTDRNAGFGVSGLARLGPLAAPWLYQMLSHDDDRVVRDAFDALAHTRSIIFSDMREYLLDTIDAIVKHADWSACAKRLKESCSDEDRTDRLAFMLGYASDYRRNFAKG